MARKLILFMPIAFGRIMMDELGANLRDEFIYTRKKGIFTDKTQKKLTDEKIYRESLKKASQMSGKKETGEIFLAIAFRSCEVNAVNDMELKGLNPQNAVFTPIEFFWELDEDQEHDDLESTQPKNWWEFWK